MVSIVCLFVLRFVCIELLFGVLCVCCVCVLFDFPALCGFRYACVCVVCLLGCIVVPCWLWCVFVLCCVVCIVCVFVWCVCFVLFGCSECVYVLCV